MLWLGTNIRAGACPLCFQMGAHQMCLQVEPQEKPKVPKGRARQRIKYTRRFTNATIVGGGKRKVCATVFDVAIWLRC